MTVPLTNPQSVAESLMLAIVASSDVPLLLLGGDLDVIAVSNSSGAAAFLPNNYMPVSKSPMPDRERRCPSCTRPRWRGRSPKQSKPPIFKVKYLVAEMQQSQ